MKHQGLSLGVLAVVLMASFNNAGAGRSAGSHPVSVLVRTVAIGERIVTRTLRGFGTIEPGPQQLRAIVARRTSEVRLGVVPGIPVRKGEPLVTLSPTPKSAAQYAAAEAQARYARSALQRTESLFRLHLATGDQLAAARKNLQSAQADLAAEQQMGGGRATVLQAPQAGIVNAVFVVSGARVTGDTTLLTLLEPGGLYARIGMVAAEAAQVRRGMPVMLQSVFASAQGAPTRISAVGGLVDPATGLVDVLAPVPGGSAATLIPGTDVSAAITLEMKRSLAVPRSAVLRDARGAYVFVVANGRAHRVAVQTGPDDSHWIAVRGALHTGDRVVVTGNYELSDGMAVREQAR